MVDEPTITKSELATEWPDLYPWQRTFLDQATNGGQAVFFAARRSGKSWLNNYLNDTSHLSAGDKRLITHSHVEAEIPVTSEMVAAARRSVEGIPNDWDTDVTNIYRAMVALAPAKLVTESERSAVKERDEARRELHEMHCRSGAIGHIYFELLTAIDPSGALCPMFEVDDGTVRWQNSDEVLERVRRQNEAIKQLVIEHDEARVRIARLTSEAETQASRMVDFRAVVSDQLTAKDARIVELEAFSVGQDEAALVVTREMNRLSDGNLALRDELALRPATFVDPTPEPVKHNPFRVKGDDPRRMGPLVPR